MKKRVFREKYYGGIDATGENYGNKKVIKDKTTKIKKKNTKKGKKDD